MRFKHAILLVIALGTLSGCQWKEARWPWEKEKEIPLTQPVAVVEIEQDIAT